LILQDPKTRRARQTEKFMKKSHMLAAGLALAGAAQVHAQSSVQIYGLYDVAIERLTNPSTAGGSLVRVPDLAGGTAPSRLGFRGTEDLGGGLATIFTLEMGFAPDSGNMNQGGRAFGRQAFVGMKGEFGEVTIGRVYTMLGGSLADIDVMGPGQYGLGALDPYLPNARADNAVAYRGTFSGISVGATYSLGRDSSSAGGPGATNCPGESGTDKGACREWSALLRYDAANWGAAVGYDRYRGGAGALVAFGPNSSALTDTRVNVGAYGKFGPLKVGGGVLSRKNEGVTTITATANPRSSIYYIAASYNFTPAWVLEGQLARYDLKDSGNDTDQAVVRALYNFSKRTATYVEVGNVRNKGTAARSVSSGGTVAAGATQTGLMAGIRHTF
jgi:predicted porin